MLPAAGPTHGRYDGLGPEEHALGVDLHDVVPIVSGGFLDVLAENDGGVVDEDVHLAELLLGGVDGALPVVGAGHVEMEVDRLAAKLADLGFHLHTEVIADVADDHFRAFLGEHPGLGGALAAGAAGDDCNLAFEPHGVASWSASSMFTSAASSSRYSSRNRNAMPKLITSPSRSTDETTKSATVISLVVPLSLLSVTSASSGDCACVSGSPSRLSSNG